MSILFCRECSEGKHVNCDGTALDAETDDLTSCTCPDPSHGRSVEKDAPAKRPWHAVEPKDAVALRLPHDEIQGPYNENGEECPWPWEPVQLKGAPLGQYRCPYCMAMVMAGMEHIDYGPLDEQGRSWLDRTDEEQTSPLPPAEPGAGRITQAGPGVTTDAWGQGRVTPPGVGA